MAQLPRYQSSGIAVGTPQGQFRDVSAPFDQLSAQMNKMTEFYLQEAKVQAVAQAEEYAADKAPTIQQIEEARLYNKPLEPIADKTTIFGRAANEAQSRILAKNVAAAADMQMAQLQQDVSAGKIQINDIANQTNALIKGYSSALADVDPMIARSLEADLALSGNRLFVSATKAAASEALEKQKLAIAEANKVGVTNGIVQIFAAGPIVVDDMGKKFKIDEAAQIQSLYEKAKARADALPVKERKAAYKDIQTSLKEGAERYGQEVVIKGGLNDLKVLDLQIRSGKFDFAITDPKDRIELLSKVKTRIDHLETIPNRQIKINQQIIDQQMKDAKAAISAGNRITSIPTEDEINASYPNPEDELKRQLALRERASLNLTSQITYEMMYQSKKTRDELLDQSKKQAVDEDGLARYNAIKSVNDNIEQQVKKDSADYSMRFAEVNTAWTNALEKKAQESAKLNEGKTSDPSIVAGAMSEYIEATKQRQIEAGVLPGDVNYFPKNWVETYRDVFNNQLKSGVNAADFFMNESQFWGGVWPDLVKEMKLGTELLIISNMSSSLETRRAAQVLAQAAQPENKKALMEVYSGEKKNIVSRVSGLMEDFRLSLRSPAIKDGAAIEQSVLDSTVLLTMAYMQQGMGEADASQKAYGSIIENQYGFAAGFRVPKTLGINLPTQIIEENANLIKANIDFFRDQIMIPQGLTSKSQGLTVDEEADIYFDSLRSSGGFVNTSDDRYGVRMIDATGKPVRFKDGSIFEITWDQLNKPAIADLPSEVETRNEAQKANYIKMRDRILISYNIKSKDYLRMKLIKE
jgi:hypothetical protein